MIPYKQLSLADIFTDCQEKLDNDKPAFLSLLETHIDIDEFIPISFRNHFYASTGRTRKSPFKRFAMGFNYSAYFFYSHRPASFNFSCLFKTAA